MSARPTAACSPTASRSMSRAARCPSRSAMASSRRTSCKTLGADMLRLWVAATDYANEMSLSQEILKRITDSYRRMRNTVRFLLGNLHDFDPAQSLRRRTSWWRWTAGRSSAHAGAAAGDRAGLSRLRLSSDLSEGAQLLRGGSRRSLSRHSARTGSTRLPAASRARRSAQTAHVAHRRGHGALAGADPVLHRRGDVAAPARATRASRCS